MIIQTLQQRLQLPTQNPVIVDAYAIFYNLMSDPLMTVEFMGLWVYPLTTWFWRKRASIIATSNWAFLDRSSQSRLMTPSSQAPFRLRLGLNLGLAGSVVYGAMLFLFQNGLKIDLSFDETTLLAILLQGVIVAIMAGSIRRQPVFHGLFAAFFAGCMMDIGISVFALQFLPYITLETTWKVILVLNDKGVYTTTINEGVLLALRIGLIVSALAGWLRRSRRAVCLNSGRLGRDARCTHRSRSDDSGDTCRMCKRCRNRWLGSWGRLGRLLRLECLLESIRESVDARIPIRRIFRQSAQDHGVKRRRDAGIKKARWSGLHVQVLIPQLLLASLERRSPCEELVRHHCQCILVAGRNCHAGPLFRSKGAWKTDGRLRAVGHFSALSFIIVSKLKIRKTRVYSARADKKTGRGDVSMNALVIVEQLEDICRLADQRRDFLR